MEWKIDISGITGAAIERAKVEAARRQAEELEKLNQTQRAIAEQLETLNKTIDTGFGLVIDALMRKDIK